MSRFITGIDDIATETQVSEGWCYFVLSQTEYTRMEAEARGVLCSSNMKAFHAKKFVTTEQAAYTDFLNIIKRYLDNSAPSLCCCTLNNQQWQGDFVKFCNGVATGVFTQVGVTDTELIDVTKEFVPATFTLQRLISTFGSANELTLEIDSDTIKDKFRNISTIIKGHTFSASFLLEKLFNAYRTEKFPDCPEVIPNGISVVNDAKSIAVQAADVVGNFSTSCIYSNLGNKSKKRILKGQIFESVFGNHFGGQDFSKDVELVGDNDLKLKRDGAFTFQFGLM